MDIKTRLKYWVNDTYNWMYCRSRSIHDRAPVYPRNFKNTHATKDFAEAFQLVWLLNVARLIRKAQIDPRDHHFLDVGCGKGIAALFVLDRFFFQTVAGFDFEPGLIQAAEKNWRNSILGSKPVTYFVEDAGGIVLPEKKYFLFLFNPFSAEVFKLFMKNNVEMLRKTESVLGFANCRYPDVLRSFPHREFVDIPGYRSAVVKI